MPTVQHVQGSESRDERDAGFPQEKAKVADPIQPTINQNSHSVSLRVQFPVEFRAWQNMIHRCYNPSVYSYRWYGKKRIRVCKQWRRNFAAFLAHIGPKPSPRHSLDRIDSKKSYKPGNVRWATPQEQTDNSSRPRLITVNGETLSVSAWARRLGITPQAITVRLNRYGWSEVDAVTTPSVWPRKNHRRQEAR